MPKKTMDMGASLEPMKPGRAQIPLWLKHSRELHSPMPYLLLKPVEGGPLTFKLSWHEAQGREMVITLYNTQTPADSEG